jgi:AraC-like DNA-binding protein
MKNSAHFDQDFGWFIGDFSNNQKHKHYAIQLSIPLEGPLTIITDNAAIKTENPILIPANVFHQVVSDHKQFLLLINPASPIGPYWNKLARPTIQEANLPAAIDIKTTLLNTYPSSIPKEELRSVIEKYDCQCGEAIHKGDQRINKALIYLSTNYHRVVPLAEVAGHCNLSPSRFLHLFKEETKMTFRRAQLWAKLMHGLPYFGRKPLTEIAHQVGFSDSAHLSRVFKENFGFSPRDFLKISQFVQV